MIWNSSYINGSYSYIVLWMALEDVQKVRALDPQDAR